MFMSNFDAGLAVPIPTLPSEPLTNRALASPLPSIRKSLSLPSSLTTMPLASITS
jgi:hypothetical protein